MNSKGLDFKHKEVINIKNAQKLGCVQDVTADLCTGNITSIIVPGTSKFFRISFIRRNFNSVECYKMHRRRNYFSRLLTLIHLYWIYKIFFL